MNSKSDQKKLKKFIKITKKEEHPPPSDKKNNPTKNKTKPHATQVNIVNT